jgi:hypothetical protein
MIKKLFCICLWLLILAAPARAALTNTDTARLTGAPAGHALSLHGSTPTTRNA